MPCIDRSRGMNKALSLISLGLLLAACAQVRDISGGDKDGQPPQLVAADPPAESLRFSGSRITLRFDERIQLDRVRDRLLVSPPLDAPPTVRISQARNVVIDLNAPLLPNTTYSFGIGEAVKDLTEGNPAAGLTYVISTGDHLDSMLVMGRVVNAFSGAAEADVLVSLYQAGDTTTLRSGRPAYATRSDAEGRFVLRHLRAGTYRLHALRDQNSNYRYDLPNEEVAFLDSMIVLDPSDTVLPSPTLHLFQALSPVQAVRDARVIPDGAFRVVLARPGQRVELRDVLRTGGVLRWNPEWTAERDTVLLWPSDTTALSDGRYELTCDGEVIDTLRYRAVEKMPYHTAVKPVVKELVAEAVVELRAARPVVAVDTGRIQVLRDSVPVAYRIMPDPENPRILKLSTDLPPGGSAQLILLPKALRDLYGLHNDSLSTGLGRAAEKSTGTLRIKLDERRERAHDAIVQLLDMRGGVVREGIIPVGGNMFAWERLTPGDHTLKIVLDRNGNGRWDTGDLDKGVQPEQVIAHGQALNVRAAWDLAVDLTIE